MHSKCLDLSFRQLPANRYSERFRNLIFSHSLIFRYEKLNIWIRRAQRYYRKSHCNSVNKTSSVTGTYLWIYTLFAFMSRWPEFLLNSYRKELNAYHRECRNRKNAGEKVDRNFRRRRINVPAACIDLSAPHPPPPHSSKLRYYDPRRISEVQFKKEGKKGAKNSATNLYLSTTVTRTTYHSTNLRINQSCPDRHPSRSGLPWLSH